MPAVTRYKLQSVLGPVGLGATGATFISVHGLAKANSPAHPLVVVNEIVCSALAHALLLPTPPGFIVEIGGAPHFVSLDFNLAGQQLPPIDPAALINTHARLAAGILVFDVWIVNSDRHTQNLAFDTQTNQVQIFDHSHALLHPGTAGLIAQGQALGIGGHCLAPHLHSIADLRYWCEYLNTVPEQYVRGVLEMATSLGVPANEATQCADFLVDRKSRVEDLLRNNTANFPNIPTTDWQTAPPAAGPAAAGQQVAAPAGQAPAAAP